MLQIQGLKNLGLNIRRAKLSPDTKNKFYVTDAVTAEKITKSVQLEEIRQVILHNMMSYHPGAFSFAASSHFDLTSYNYLSAV